MFPRYLYQCIALLLTALIAIFVCIVFIWHVIPEYENIIVINVLFVLGLVSLVYAVTYVLNKIRGVRLSFSIIPSLGLLPSLIAFGVLFTYITGESLLVNSYYPFRWTEQSWILLLFSVIIGPVAEEFVFRGIFLKGLLSNPKYPKWLSIMEVSILFAIIHYNLAPQATTLFNVFAVGNAFVLSLFISWLYYKTDNLGNVILVHIGANACALFFQYVFSEIQVQMQHGSEMFAILGIMLILISIGLFWAFNGKIKYSPMQEPVLMAGGK